MYQRQSFCLLASKIKLLAAHIDMLIERSKKFSCITTQKAKVTNPCSTRTCNLDPSSRRSAVAFMWCTNRSLQQRKGYISIKYSIQLVCVCVCVWAGGTSLPTSSSSSLIYIHPSIFLWSLISESLPLDKRRWYLELISW